MYFLLSFHIPFQCISCIVKSGNGLSHVSCSVPWYLRHSFNHTSDTLSALEFESYLKLIWELLNQNPFDSQYSAKCTSIHGIFYSSQM